MTQRDDFLDSIFDVDTHTEAKTEQAKDKAHTDKAENKATEQAGAAENEAAEHLNNDTELVFIFDESGSMSGFEADTVGGFNSMIKKQRGGEGKVYVSTVFFNTSRRVLHDRADIDSISLMTERDYSPGGCTALLDAIGHAILHISNVHKYARREDVPAHTIFAITTDGMENASREFTAEAVKRMIKEKTEACGWEFIFLAANIDAVSTADSIGIRSERAATYQQTHEGMADCFESMSLFADEVRLKSHVNGAWRSKLS